MVAVSHFFDLLYYYRKHGGWFSVIDAGRFSRLPSNLKGPA
jgi:hypothetical protein